MLRIVTQLDDAGMAANVGGNVLTKLRTFDVDLPEIEAYLKSTTGNGYAHVQVIGVEVLPNTTPEGSTHGK